MRADPAAAVVLAAITGALSEFAGVSVEPQMALLCAVGDRLRNEPEIAWSSSIL